MDTNTITMTRAYKVEFTRSEKFVIDIRAENEEEARKLAEVEMEANFENGIAHYHEMGDPETEISYLYDVTGTDDEPKE